MPHDHAHDHDDHSHAGHSHAGHDHSGHDHGHGHSHGIGGHHHGPVDTGDWRYAVGLIINLAFVVAEFTAGFIAVPVGVMTGVVS